MEVSVHMLGGSFWSFRPCRQNQRGRSFLNHWSSNRRELPGTPFCLLLNAWMSTAPPHSVKPSSRLLRPQYRPATHLGLVHRPFAIDFYNRDAIRPSSRSFSAFAARARRSRHLQRCPGRTSRSGSHAAGSSRVCARCDGVAGNQASGIVPTLGAICGRGRFSRPGG